MEPVERWRHVDAAFAKALDLSALERASFLEEACAGDEQLRQHVQGLLSLHEAADHFLEDPLDWFAPLLEPGLDAVERPVGSTGAQEGQRVGPYRLLDQIGCGGMGTVFLAERADGQYRQRVALKLIQGGLDSAETLRRFRLERQVLAQLQHPHIARLLDGGLAEDGRPYFVMEYVPGTPLTRYCDAHQRSIEQRLGLFRSVCQAVQYAHQNLIVHRDLKPSNILVTEDGQVKLLDFGIAKLLDPEAFEPTLALTQTDVRLMTPEYAAPEQVRGEAITTATDVYALGVLLYELLTGHRPYRLTGRLLHEVERLICEEEPEKPSVAVTRTEEVRQAGGRLVQVRPEEVSRGRGTATEKLRRRLSGDLDQICLKALKKEPERRYASVGELSEDLRRHLEGQAVLVRKDTLWYRSSKFVRRHRVGVGAAALVLVTLIAGVVATAWQVRVATIEAARARIEAAKAERINAFLQEMLSSLDPMKGRKATVEDVLEAASGRIESGLADQPEVAAAAHHTVGVAYSQLSLYDKAEPHLQRALSLRRALYGENHADVAESLMELGLVVHGSGGSGNPESIYREALAMRREVLGNEHPDVAMTMEHLGNLLRNRGRYEEAEPLLREALHMRRKLLGEEHPDVARSLYNLGRLMYYRGNHEEAELLLNHALAIQRTYYGVEHPHVAKTLQYLGHVMRYRGDYDRALSLYQGVLAMRRRVLAEKHEEVAATMEAMAVVHFERGRYEAAERSVREALAMQQEVLGERHWRVGTCLEILAAILQARGKYEDAELLYRETLAIRQEKAPLVHPSGGATLGYLAGLLYEKGDHQQADSLYRQALSLLRRTLPEGHPYLSDILIGLGVLLSEQGDLSSAERLLREGLSIRRNTLPAGHWRIAQAESALGSCLTRLRRFGEAEALLVGSLPALKVKRGGGDRDTHEALRHLVNLYEAWGRPEKATMYRALYAE